jgi:hypothetical protein
VDYLGYVLAFISLFRINIRLIHTLIINTTLLIVCHPDVFQPSKDVLQGVGKINFNSKVKKNVLLNIKFLLVNSL